METRFPSLAPHECFGEGFLFVSFWAERFKMQKDIDHRNTEEIVCPYCGFAYQDSWEIVQDGKMNCEECGEKFNYFIECSVSYFTEKIKPIELDFVTATLEDLLEIMKMEYLGFEKGISESEEVFKKRIEDFPDGFLIAKQKRDSFCVGYITGKLINLQDKELSFDIESVTVHPSFRGHGIGKTLLREVTDRIKEKHKPTKSILYVNPKWKQARKIYEEEGYEITGIVQPYFLEAREDAFVMEKRF